MIAQTKYKRYDWDLVFKNFEASGLSRAAYCRLEQINHSSFSVAWRRFGKGKSNPRKSSSFIKVRMAPLTPEVTVEFANGVRLMHFPIDRIADLAALKFAAGVPSDVS